MIDPGKLTHVVDIKVPSAPVSDGDGGYTETLSTFASNVWCSFESAAARDIQRLAGGNATLSAATHIVEMHYLAGVTTKMSAWLGARELSILGVQNVDEADVMTRLFCEEVIE